MRKKAIPQPKRAWSVSPRKRHIKVASPKQESPPCRRKVISAPEPIAILPAVGLKKLDHSWTAQLDNSPVHEKPVVRRKMVEPVSHPEKNSRRKPVEAPYPSFSPPPTSRKKSVRPPSPKERTMGRLRATEFSRRHLDQSDALPVPIPRKKIVVPPWATHDVEKPTKSGKKAVPRAAIKQKAFSSFSGKRAIKPAWEQSTIRLV